MSEASSGEAVALAAEIEMLVTTSTAAGAPDNASMKTLLSRALTLHMTAEVLQVGGAQAPSSACGATAKPPKTSHPRSKHQHKPH
jgi:hypothetical protein